MATPSAGVSNSNIVWSARGIGMLPRMKNNAAGSISAAAVPHMKIVIGLAGTNAPYSTRITATGDHWRSSSVSVQGEECRNKPKTSA